MPDRFGDIRRDPSEHARRAVNDAKYHYLSITTTGDAIAVKLESRNRLAVQVYKNDEDVKRQFESDGLNACIQARGWDPGRIRNQALNAKRPRPSSSSGNHRREPAERQPPPRDWWSTDDSTNRVDRMADSTNGALQPPDRHVPIATPAATPTDDHGTARHAAVGIDPERQAHGNVISATRERSEKPREEDLLGRRPRRRLVQWHRSARHLQTRSAVPVSSKSKKWPCVTRQAQRIALKSH